MKCNLDEIYTYHECLEEDIPKYVEFRAKCKELAQFISDTAPDRPEKWHALIKLEECQSWFNSAMVRGRHKKKEAE